MVMKIYCEKCKKVFEAEKPEEGNQVSCTFCREKVDFPESPTSPGAVIGDFLIEKEISKGGMGEVYLARQLSLDRPVALKVLQAKFLNDKEYVESFFREARAAGRISHPNVVQAYAVGEENGIFYFAMEYIRGKTMKEILKQEKTIEFRKAAKIIREVASALECAWRDEKLVHQDIKPDNIMLDANGFAKLADLGLARVAGINDKEACEGDEVLGTPQYISPEQLTGIPTDVRSDIYSLGATFYQFVTGRFPYVADSAEEIAKMHVAGNLQPPKEVNPELPDELNTIIMKMMARNIEDRYQTPATLIKALDLYLQNSVHAGAGAVPQLKFRLPGAGQNAAAPRTPFGGGAAKTPFAAAGARTPFAARGPAAAMPKANPPKPAVPSAVPKAVPPKAVTPVVAPKVAAPVAAPKSAPSVAAESSGKVADVKKLDDKEVKKNNEKKSDDDALALKVVPKAEKPAVSPVETPEESGKDKKKEKKKKEKEDGERNIGKTVMMAIGTLIMLLITLGCLGGAFYFLAAGNKLPSAIQPYGDKLVAMIQGKENKLPTLNLPPDPGQKKPDDKTAGPADLSKTPKPAEGQKPEEQPKPKIETRREYLAAIDKLMERIRSNPDDRVGFLEESDRFFRQFPNFQTPEEETALRPFLNAFHRVDEVARVAPARAAAHAEFTTALGKRHAAAEAAERELAEKQERERQQREQAEAERKRLAEEKAKRDAEAKAVAAKRLAEVMPKLRPLFGKVANSFLVAARTGNTIGFNRDLSELRMFPFVPGESAEEMRILNQLNTFGSDLPNELKNLRAFVERLGKITPDNDSFSIEMPNRDLLTITGVKPDSITAVDGLGKQVPFDLSDSRVRTIFIQRLERRLKLQKPGFYLDMMTGNFTPETEREAADHAFWKTYYKPFMTAYFFDRLTAADAAAKAALEKRYGKLPEFQAALEAMK